MPQPTPLTYHGITRSIREWSDFLNIDYHTLLTRLHRRASPEQAIETPVRHKGRGPRTHGMTGSKEYRAWTDMKFRCENARGNRWHRYGGRGISVCKRWRDSFEKFLEDVGPAPSRRHSIGRLDHDKGYCVQNCRWMLREEDIECKRRSQRRGNTS